MRKFVMGDIHGAYLALLQCLERSGFDRGADLLIQLGDVADGYPQVYQCVEELLGIRNLIAISGNHDQWLEEFLLTGYHPYHWNHGGRGTLISYLDIVEKQGMYFQRGNGLKTALEPVDVPASHHGFFGRQMLYHTDEQDRCFVHGGFDRHRKIEDQNSSVLCWDRELWKDALAHIDTGRPFGEVNGFSEIYIGHTPTQNWGSEVPMNALNIINMDTGAGHRGRLTIMEIESGEYWQSDPVGELYPQYAGRDS